VGLKKFIHFNKSFTGILGLITAVTILTSTSVVALTQYEFNCAAQGDIGGTCFYNPDNCGSSTGSSTGSGDVSALSGKDNIGKTINFFIQEGLTLTQASGIAANFAWETGGGVAIDPTLYGQGPTQLNHKYGLVWGVATWTGQGNIDNYIEDKSKNKITGSDALLLTQLLVVWAEMSGKGTYNGGTNIVTGLKKVTNGGEAATYFEQNFEICDTSDASCGVDRVNSGNQFVKEYGNEGNTPIGTDSGGTSTGSSTSGDTCGSGSDSGASVGADGLSNPFPNGWVPNRLDMGYDGHFTKQIVAPCSGTMSYVDADSDHSYNGGWNGAYFVLKCSQTISGIPSSSFYFAEGVSPTVSQGQSVNAGQQIGKPGWTGYTEGPGGIEWGLTSSTPMETLAASLGNSCVVGSASQKMVMGFSQWFQQALRVAPPATTDHAGCA
jgi:hypothetical protein